MQLQIAYKRGIPENKQAIELMGKYDALSGLDPTLLDFASRRASQINGCAYCVDIHTKDERAKSENRQRLHGFCGWHEMSFYTAREQAALAWAGAATLVADGHAPDAMFTIAR